MSSTLCQFEDRRHAGRLLAGALSRYAGRPDVIVLGLPRGGVPVAYEVAGALQAPLDVIVVRKLGVPGWEELAMGAISCGGVRVLNDEVIRHSSVTTEQIEEVTARELKELARREIAFRGRRGAPEINGKTVLLIDDGMATGSTVQAAAAVMREASPESIVVGVPVASAEACALIKPGVDDLVVLLTPDDFRAVGYWYMDFGQTTDDEVVELLALAAKRPPAASPGTPVVSSGPFLS